MREYPRRRLLQALAGLTAGSVAGCAGDESGPPTSTRQSTVGSATSESVARTTDKTPSDDATTDETTQSDEIATEAWTVDSLDGDVEGLWLPNRPRRPNTTGGPLFAATNAGTVANVAVMTGEVRWTTTVLGDQSPHSHPTVHETGSSLLVVSQSWNEDTLRNYVERVAPETGDRQWAFEAREFLSPLGVVDDALYLGGEYMVAPPEELGPNRDPTGEGRIHAVDVATGEELWRTTVPSLIDATAASHGIYAYVAPEDEPSDHQLVAFDRDGTERWRTEAGRHHLPGPVAVDDGVLASVGADAVAAFAPDGTEQWRVSGWRYGPSEIEVTRERIYVGSDPLVAVSRSGTERWRLDDHGGVVRPIRDGTIEDTLYLGGGTEVGAVEASEGTKRWSYAPEDEKYVHEQAVVEDGLLVTTGIGWDHEFVLLDEASGDVLGNFRTRNSYRAATTVASRLFAGASGGDIYAFDVEP